MRLGEARDDGRRRLNCAGLVRDVRTLGIEDHPLIPDEQPAIDCICSEHLDRRSGGLGRNELLLDDAEIRRDDGAAIVAAEGQCEAQWLDQHTQPERRAAAADRKPYAARMQTLDRGNRARRQDLVGRDERAVDIGDDERDFHRRAAPPEVNTLMPPCDATMTAELRPTKSPFSTTPTIA